MVIVNCLLFLLIPTFVVVAKVVFFFDIPTIRY